mgnify:CR=1 FL=1
MQKVFEFQALGITMDFANKILDILLPSYIKIDVDGIEHLVLKGGFEVLQTVKGLLIEVNDDFHEQANLCQELPTLTGLVLQEKRHSEMFDSNDAMGVGHVWNQIWTRK